MDVSIGTQCVHDEEHGELAYSRALSGRAVRRCCGLDVDESVSPLCGCLSANHTHTYIHQHASSATPRTVTSTSHLVASGDWTFALPPRVHMQHGRVQGFRDMVRFTRDRVAVIMVGLGR